MKTSVRVGIIGVGGMAGSHLSHLQHIEGVEVTALCDTNPAQLERAKGKFPFVRDAFITADYRTLLAREDVDAVQIITPHTLHFEQVNAAMDAGKHILCEKPMVSSVAQAHDLLKRNQSYDKVFALAYQRHAMGQFVMMREKIQSGELGSVTYLSAMQCQGWKHAVKGTWRQDPALSGGGQINDSGSHLVDILLWVTGLTVAQVSAFMDYRGTPVDIDSAISLTFTTGAIGNISVIGDTVVGWHEDISIWCERGAFFYRNGDLTFVDHNNVRTTLDGTAIPGTRNIDEDFIQVIRGERAAPAAPPTCGLRTIELTEAAWKSAADGGRPVRMNP